MTINLQLEKIQRKIQYEGIEYLINYADKTAGVIGYTSSKKNVMIPRSIIYESKEFIVTSILEHAFDSQEIKSIKFAADSEVRTIESCAFELCYIEYISFPSSLVELKEGWSTFMFKVSKIEVMPNNKYFKVYDNKYLLAKSSIEKETFDTIIFCMKDIVDVKIPNFIEIIGIDSFSFCQKIRTIEFEPNSKLRIISKSAFHHCFFEKFWLPPSVTMIDQSAFRGCNKLKQIDIPINSNLRTIKGSAFEETLISNILFPSKLVELDDYWMHGMKNLGKIQISKHNPCFTVYDKKFVIGKSNIESNEYDTIIFAQRGMKSVTIPQFIKIIGSDSFYNSKIKEINIPDHITKVCKGAFSKSQHLKKVDFDVDSKLKIIDDCAFLGTSIKSITIPKSVEIIGACAFPKMIQQIEFKEDSKLQVLSDSSLSDTHIKSIFIPSNTKTIGRYSFSSCKRLQKITIPADSKLQIIDEYAFYKCAIESFWIPPHVYQIGVNAFGSCEKLQIVEIDEKTKIQFIDKCVFKDCKNAIIMIPAGINNLFDTQNLSI